MYSPYTANNNTAFMSKTQFYGGTKTNTDGLPTDPRFVRRQRQRMNLLAVGQCLFIPWLLFCFSYAITAFKMHYSQPAWCWTLIGVFAFITVIAGMGAVGSIRAKLKQDESREPTWFVFLFVTMAIALICGVVFGNMTFWSFMQKYYDYKSLNDYQLVDVARTRGEQLMDAGSVSFTQGSGLDLRKSMGFKNLDVYCVAPITVTNANFMRTELNNYDFWAVGTNCCSGDYTDFHCGEFDNPKARSGVRLLEDESRAFYRLAVQQAESVYHVKANHPLFFYWAEEPSVEIESWRAEGYKFAFIGMLAHFCWQFLCVVLGVHGFSKMGHY
jgi:hypothetical protein